VLANISDKVIEWALGLDNCSPYIDKGNFRFVRESGASFLTHKTGGVRGKLDPGETFEFGVFFCPGRIALPVSLLTYILYFLYCDLYTITFYTVTYML